MIYSLEQIKEIIRPIMQKYKVKAAGIFGSYAKNKAWRFSSIDLWVVPESDTFLSDAEKFDFQFELEHALDKEVAVVLESVLLDQRNKDYYSTYKKRVKEDLKVIYGNEQALFAK